MTINTHLKSAFCKPQKFAVQIALILLSCSSPLLFYNISWAQSVNRTQVLMQSQQQNNVQQSLDEIQVALNKFNHRGATSKEKDEAIDILRKNLKNPDKQVRITVLNALNGIGTGADAALNDLKNMLKTEKDDVVLSSIISAIRSINFKPAIPELTNIFKNEQQNLQVRLLALDAFNATYTEEAEELIPLLLDLLRQQDLDQIDLRISATRVLSRICENLNPEKYPSVVPTLTDALEDPAWRVRQYAADALGNMGVQAKSSVPQLIQAYNKELNYTPRQRIVIAFGKIGKGNEEEALRILPELRKALEDKNLYVRGNATDALRDVAARLEEAANSNRVRTKELNNTVSELEKALNTIEKFDPQERLNLNPKIQNIETSLGELQRRQAINQILNNPSLWGIGIYLVSLFGIFWLRPLWLLKIDRTLKSVGSFKLPFIDKQISLSWLLLMLKYHPRVLDAWVEAHIKLAQEAFLQKDTVRHRNVHIPIPVVLSNSNNNKTVAQLTGKDLRSTFTRQHACLLIQGEGGVGKTSLSCQIAKWAMSDNETERLCKHRMLPVLIEEELEIPDEIKIETGLVRKSYFICALINAIQGQLQNLTDEMEPISEELLERLLRQRRILVIVDHLSEMSEATRKAIHPDSPDFYVNALVVTSRSEEKLGQVTKTTLKPLRIQGNRLSSFMEAYLVQANKRDLFTDPEFFQACSRLSQMVGERNITALLAKLYADQLIAAKVEEIQQVPLVTPGSIPELMLWYINELNRSVSEGNKLSDRTVQQDAKTIAWECLKQTFRPTTAGKDAALAALKGNDAENRLKYLEERLRLIQTVGAAEDKIRFTLDPLAEYLAAMQVLELGQKNQQFWNEFWRQVKMASEEIELITGFLLALQDCSQVLGKETNVPEEIALGLSELLDSSSNTHTISQKTLIQTHLISNSSGTTEGN